MDGGTGDSEILLLAGGWWGSLNNLMSQLLQVAEAASRQVGRPSPIRARDALFPWRFFSSVTRFWSPPKRPIVGHNLTGRGSCISRVGAVAIGRVAC